MNNQNKSEPSDWLTLLKSTISSKAGTLKAKDSSGMPILLQWEKIEPQSKRLTEYVVNISPLLIPTYTQMELEFAQTHPEAVPNEFFLKSLGPLFEQGPEQVDWQTVEQKIKDIFEAFFTTTDFAQFSGAHDLQLLVTAKDPITNALLGMIQFLVTPNDESGSVKAGFYGIAQQAGNRDVDKLLMSSIFKLAPMTTRIFLHTRSTNTTALELYKTWGFSSFASPTPMWSNMEYLAEAIDPLQSFAEQNIV